MTDGVTDEIVKFAVPQLVRTVDTGFDDVFIGWLPKLIDGEFRHTAGAVATPTPVSVLSCGLPAALSVERSTAGRDPAVVGLNATCTVQLNP